MCAFSKTGTRAGHHMDYCAFMHTAPRCAGALTYYVGETSISNSIHKVLKRVFNINLSQFIMWHIIVFWIHTSLTTSSNCDNVFFGFFPLLRCLMPSFPSLTSSSLFSCNDLLPALLLSWLWALYCENGALLWCNPTAAKKMWNNKCRWMLSIFGRAGATPQIGDGWCSDAQGLWKRRAWAWYIPCAKIF